MIIAHPTFIFCMEKSHPLHFAALMGDHKEIKNLLAQGADPNKTTEEQKTPLHFANTVKSAQLLIDYGANVNAKNEHGETPLNAESSRMECSFKQHQAISELLLQNGADINTTDQWGRSLLHRAVRENRPWVADFFLARGINRFILDDEGLTAFERAVNQHVSWKNRYEMLAVFEKHGIAYFPRIEPARLLSTPEWVMPDNFDIDNSSHVAELNQLAKLFMCANKCTVQKMYAKSIVISHNGCIIHNISHKQLENSLGIYAKKTLTLLFKALNNLLLEHIKKGNFQEVSHLIKLFPWITQFDIQNINLMMKMAIVQPKTPDGCLGILLKNNIRTDFEGFIPHMHTAVWYDKPDAIKLLAKHGFDLLQKDFNGKNPMQVALLKNRNKCVEVLNKLMCQACSVSFLLEDKKSRDLLSHITNPNILLGGGYTILHRILGANPKKVVKFIPLLVAQGADLNQPSSRDETPLWQLLGQINNENDQLPVFRKLLDCGACVNKKCTNKTSSLLDTVMSRGYFRLAKLFLWHGAMVEEKMLGDCYNNTPQEIKRLLHQIYSDKTTFVDFGHANFM